MKFPRTLRSWMLAAAAALAAGCAGDPGPVAPAPGNFASDTWMIAATPMPDDDLRLSSGRAPYPLQLGNTWKYRAHVRLEAEGGAVDPPQEIVRMTRSEIIGGITLLDRCYTIEQSTLTEDIAPGEVSVRTVYYRQDRAGLYEADIAAETPTLGPPAGREFQPDPPFAAYLASLADAPAWLRAGSVAGERMRQLRRLRQAAPAAGAQDGELLRLDYPLRRGKSWVILDGAFRLTATVEGREILDLPVGPTPAWRIRYESNLFAPEDEVHTFWGYDGYLGWRVLAHVDVHDDEGNVIGRLRLSDEEYLQERTIDRRAELACDVSSSRRPGPQTEGR